MEEIILFILKMTIILGYAGIFLLLFLENTILPIFPSEIFLLFVGVLIYLNQFNIFLAILVSTLGGIAGYLVLYYLGNKHMESLVMRCSRWVCINPKQIEKAKDWFLKHGNKSVFIARFLPGLRHLINLPAGAAKMDLTKFIIYSAIATAIWNAVFIVIGAFFASEWGTIITYFESIQWILAAIIALFVVGLIVKRYASRSWFGKKKTT